MKTKLLTMLAVLLPLFSTSLKAQEPTTYYWYVGLENPMSIDTDNLKSASNEAGWHLIGESIDGFTLTFNNDNLIEFDEKKQYYLVIPEGLDVMAADGVTFHKTLIEVTSNIENHKVYQSKGETYDVKGVVIKSGVTKYFWYVGQEDPANNSTITSTVGEQGWRLIHQPASVTKNNPLFDTTDSNEETIVGTKFANWYIAFPVDKSYRIFDSDHEDQITVGNFYIYSYVTFNEVEYVVYKGFGTARKWWGYTIYGGEVAQYYYWYAGQEHPSQVSTIVTDKSSTGWRMTGSSLTSHYGFNTTANPIASNPSQKALWYFALPANTGLGVFDAIHNDYAVDENTADKWTEYAGTCTFQGVEYIVYCTGESRSFNAHYVRPKDFVPELTLDGIKYHADAASLTASVEGVEEGFSQVDVEIPAKVDYCYSTVTNINTHAFSNNTVISSILLPGTITRIARLAFVRCSNLTSITLLGQTPPEVDVEAFSDFHYEQITLNVPEGAEEAYKQHEVWGKFFKEEKPVDPEAKYYWYVGTTEPTELNGEVANAETDKWVEIGNDLSAVKYITIDTSDNPDYSFPAWYVLMPTSLGFKPHNSIGTKDESSAWDISDSSIEGYTLYVVDEGTLEAVFSTFKKEGSLPYDENADYWYLGQTDPSTRTEIYPIALQNWAIDDAWEEIVNSSEKIEVNKQPADWDFDSFTALWYVAMPASSGYTPQDADLWETSTATIAGKDYIVYKSEGRVWELNTAFLPEGYVEENPEPEPEPTPEPASVAFTFTRGADVAVNVEGIEGVTASIEAAPAAYLTTAAAANDSILCINQNTSTATADNPNKYTLTITNNSGVDLAFDYINVCGVALNSAGNFQGLSTVRDRVFVVSYGDNTLAPATMRICDDNHCSGVATVNTFEAVDAIPAGSTYVIGVSIYTDGGAGCFYGLTRITLGKNEPEGGDVTNIESPVLEAQDSQLIYDLQGRRVTHPTKGIYIVGGKKVIMK